MLHMIKRRLAFSLMALLTVLTGVMAQTTIKVTGKVIRKTTSEPLAGVSITVKGSTVYATTNETGDFTINVPDANSLLTVSYTGMADQEIPVQPGTPLSIALEERSSGTMNEVVVVGYGQQRRSNVTGAISTVNTKELVQSPVANLGNALQGRVSGVITQQGSGEPGNDGAAIYIRGNSTFTGSMEPLYVVDGIVRDRRDFSQLDPNEVESVNILKDASSAAIFGVKGANGVILVTTKRGKSGKLTASYSFNYGFQKVTKFNDNLGSYEYATLYNEALLNDGLPLAYTQEEINKFKSGEDRSLYPNTDWQREVLGGNAPQMSHNINLSGGSDKAKYFVSLGYFDQDGLYKSLNYKRYNVRTNLDLQVTKTTKFSIDLNARLEKTTAPPTGLSQIFEHTTRNPPTIPSYYEGVGYAQVGSYVNTLRAIDPASGYNKNDANILLSTFQLEQKIPWVEGLSIKGVFAYDKRYNFRKRWEDNVYVYTKDPSTSEYIRSPYQNPKLEETFDQLGGTELQAHVNYSNRFGKHGVSGLVLLVQKEEPFNRLFASRSGYEFSIFDILNQGPVTAPDGTVTEVIQGSKDRFALRSAAARINYDYDNKYLIQASLRADESENFAPNIRRGYFPAVSAGWIVSQEEFMENTSSVLDYLKIKGSWGKLGNDKFAVERNDASGRFLYYARYNSVPATYAFGGSIVPGLNPSAVSPLVTWESSTKSDIGFEARLWKGMLNVEASFFKEKRADILVLKTAEIPATYGGPLPVQNAGEVENKGIEVNLSHERSLNKNFSYFVRTNITATKNRIISAPQSANLPAALRVLGHAINSFYGYKAIGIIKDQATLDAYNKTTQYPVGLGDIMYEDVNGRDADGKLTGAPDGKIDNDDRQYLNTGSVPLFVYGIMGGINFKGFEFNFLFQGATNTHQQLVNNAGFAFFNGGRVTAEWLDRWTPDNPNGKYPKLSTNATASTNNYQIPAGPQYGNGGNSFYIYDASYIRLKNVELAYTFKPAFLSTLSMSALRIFATGQNLLTFTRIPNVDPENTNATGWYYPVQAVYNFGINVQF
jgi:TonB-linked SusC/RagA family outer membrane protein